MSLKKEANDQEKIEIEEEKMYLLDLMKMQNEALKRIYKNTLDHENRD